MSFGTFISLTEPRDGITLGEIITSMTPISNWAVRPYYASISTLPNVAMWNNPDDAIRHALRHLRAKLERHNTQLTWDYWEADRRYCDANKCGIGFNRYLFYRLHWIQKFTERQLNGDFSSPVLDILFGKNQCTMMELSNGFRMRALSDSQPNNITSNSVIVMCDRLDRLYFPQCVANTALTMLSDYTTRSVSMAHDIADFRIDKLIFNRPVHPINVAIHTSMTIQGGCIKEDVTLDDDDEGEE